MADRATEPWPVGAWAGLLQDANYAHRDYAGEAATLVRLLDQILPNAGSLLDVACGTGLHLSHLRKRYRVEGMDIDDRVLAYAADRLPDTALHQADMVDFDLGRHYDIVTSLFSSTGYALTPDRLRSAIAAMARHLNQGGVLFVEPWLTPTAFRDDELGHGVYDSPELKASWMCVQRRRGHLAVYDMDFQVGTKEDGVVTFVRHEELALFTVDDYLTAFADAGLHALHVTDGPWGYGAYVARATAPWSAKETATITRTLAR